MSLHRPRIVKLRTPVVAEDQMKTVVTVSGQIPESLADDMQAGVRPRADYVELADRLGAELLDYRMATASLGRAGPLLERLVGPNVVMAIALFRRSRELKAVLTDGEQVGLPYAALSRFSRNRPSHHMIVHIMSVKKKTVVFRGLRLGSLVDTFFVYSQRQAEVMHDLGVAKNHVQLTSFMVDTTFFDPASESVEPRNMICSAGLEYRDYETLVEAVRGLDVEVVIAAASPWSKRSSSVTESPLPDNVTTTKLSLHELRRLYAQAAFVVMPLADVEFQAGVTTILEAMSMGKAVICSRTIGQTDVLKHDETGVYVAPGDPGELRAAIERLLDQPEKAAELGAAARSWAREIADVHRYADRLAAAVQVSTPRGARHDESTLT